MKKISIALLLVAIACLIHAADVQLAWSEDIGNATGFTIFWGTISGTYSDSEDAGFVLDGTNYTGTVSNLTIGTTYYFTVQAYDSTGDLSEYSSEVAYTVDSSTNIVQIPTSYRIRAKIH